MLLRVRCEDLRALPVGELGGFAFVPVHTQMRRFVTFVAEEIHAVRLDRKTVGTEFSIAPADAMAALLMVGENALSATQSPKRPG